MPWTYDRRTQDYGYLSLGVWQCGTATSSKWAIDSCTGHKGHIQENSYFSLFPGHNYQQKEFPLGPSLIKSQRGVEGSTPCTSGGQMSAISGFKEGNEEEIGNPPVLTKK